MRERKFYKSVNVEETRAVCQKTSEEQTHALPTKTMQVSSLLSSLFHTHTHTHLF